MGRAGGEANENQLDPAVECKIRVEGARFKGVAAAQSCQLGAHRHRACLTWRAPPQVTGNGQRAAGCELRVTELRAAGCGQRAAGCGLRAAHLKGAHETEERHA